jgi:hypothetical protein
MRDGATGSETRARAARASCGEVDASRKTPFSCSKDEPAILVPRAFPCSSQTGPTACDRQLAHQKQGNVAKIAGMAPFTARCSRATKDVFALFGQTLDEKRGSHAAASVLHIGRSATLNQPDGSQLGLTRPGDHRSAWSSIIRRECWFADCQSPARASSTMSVSHSVSCSASSPAA